jgi:predicted ATP-dependent endonuclease of OLD family
MYVKQLTLSNFQQIKEFDAKFNGNIYLVTGENDIGKSSFLKAITILLTGNRDEVLSTGEEKGFAKAIVGDGKLDYEVELRFTQANPRGTLTIKQQGSEMSSSTVSALQSIFGYQEFDADEFIRWSDTAEGRRKQEIGRAHV